MIELTVTDGVLTKCTADVFETELSIPDSVKAIDRSAFSDCPQIRRIYAPRFAAPPDASLSAPLLCGFARLLHNGHSVSREIMKKNLYCAFTCIDRLLPLSMTEPDLLWFLLNYLPLRPEDSEKLWELALPLEDAEINALLLEYKRKHK